MQEEHSEPKKETDYTTTAFLIDKVNMVYTCILVFATHDSFSFMTLLDRTNFNLYWKKFVKGPVLCISLLDPFFLL